MRARRLTDGGRPAVVTVPPCVTVGPDLTATCACGARADLSALDRAEAERQLGEFARWHRRHAPPETRARRRERRPKSLGLW